MRTRALSAIPLLLVLGACGGNGDHVAASAAPTSTAAAPMSTITTPTAVTTAPSTTSTTIAPLSSASRLRIDGLGPVTVGMTLEQVQAAAGVPLKPDSTPYCRTLTAPDLGAYFIATNVGGDKVEVIVVTRGPISTLSGIHVGSARAEVTAAYGDQLTAFTDRRLVYRARDAAYRNRALVFLFDHNDKVGSMYVGAEDFALSDELCA